MKKTLEKYPDLPRRMRIEMSKRIKKKEMTLKEFGKYNLFEEYSTKCKEELKKLLFDKELLDEVYEEEIEKLSVRVCRGYLRLQNIKRCNKKHYF